MMVAMKMGGDDDDEGDGDGDGESDGDGCPTYDRSIAMVIAMVMDARGSMVIAMVMVAIRMIES